MQGSAVVLLALVTLVSWGCARLVARAQGRARKGWLAAGIVAIFAGLFFFKYAAFAVSTVLAPFGIAYTPTVTWSLPIGISFYSFAAAGYLLDVGRGLLAPAGLLEYAVFVSYFPAILSGPVGKAREFLPQLRQGGERSVAHWRSGLWRLVTGAAKKLVLADRIGVLVDTVYDAPMSFSGGLVLVAVLAYSIQIYLDFSAYSDMVLGISEMLGFRLTENFRGPYCSRSVKDFWKKWHISLTDWFREYLYVPLGGNRKGRVRQYCNILVVFAVSGLWHGAAWSFVLWGLLNGVFQVVGSLTLPTRRRLRQRLHLSEDSLPVAVVQTVLTFLLISVTWIFFRADSVAQGLVICRRLGGIARHGFGSQSILSLGLSRRQLVVAALGVALVLASDFRKTISGSFAMAHDHTVWFYASIAALLVALAVLGCYGAGFDASSYIYFRF